VKGGQKGSTSRRDKGIKASDDVFSRESDTGERRLGGRGEIKGAQTVRK